MEPEKNLRESIKKISLKKLLFSPEQSDARLKLIVTVGLAAIAVIFLSDYAGGQTRSASAQVNAAAPLHYSGTDYGQLFGTSQFNMFTASPFFTMHRPYEP